jgi:hypothetical protein
MSMTPAHAATMSEWPERGHTTRFPATLRSWLTARVAWVPLVSLNWPNARLTTWAALIGVPGQPGLRPAVGQRHLQRVGHQLGAHVVGHAPADNPPAVEVLDGDEIEPPLPRAQVGDVGHPAAVQGRRGEAAVEQVVGDPDARHADRRGLPLLLHQRRQASLAHESLDALASDALAIVEDEVRPDPRRAIDLAAQFKQLADAGR